MGAGKGGLTRPPAINKRIVDAGEVENVSLRAGQARRAGTQLVPGAAAGPAVGRWPGAPTAPRRWCRGGEPWHDGVVPGEPSWRWIHLHRLLLIWRWIHLHGLHTTSYISDGHSHRVADGASPPPPPLPPRLPQSLFWLPTQRWATARLAAVGPLSARHRGGRGPGRSANEGQALGARYL